MLLFDSGRISPTKSRKRCAKRWTNDERNTRLSDRRRARLRVNRQAPLLRQRERRRKRLNRKRARRVSAAQVARVIERACIDAVKEPAIPTAKAGAEKAAAILTAKRGARAWKPAATSIEKPGVPGAKPHRPLAERNQITAMPQPERVAVRDATVVRVRPRRSRQAVLKLNPSKAEAVKVFKGSAVARPAAAVEGSGK